MVAIKEIPTNFRVYYTCMREAYTKKKDEAVDALKELTKDIKDLYETVVKDYNTNKSEYNVKLDSYKEYVENQYITGTFFRVAKGLCLNKSNNYELVGRYFDVYRLAKLQKDIYNTKDDIALCDKMLNLSLKEYKEVLRYYYTEVEKKMVLDGCGYAFDGALGWIVINRCKLVKPKRHIDYKATKLKRKELAAEGKRIYNKDEADWCKTNGIEYKAEDARVYQNLEYAYEIALLSCHLPKGDSLKFEASDYRGRSVRGLSNKQIGELYNWDKEKICNADLDIRTKLYLCLESDKILYTKFIRNENQKPSTFK